MVLERGASISKGVRRTGVEGSFGVVRTAQNTIGTSVANLSQAVDKINQFQVDVMDKEWQNNFDTSSAIFVEEAMREELNSPNPDLVKLREKFITYRDTNLKEAPQRFQNYIENKLDLNFVDAVNNVKDYANNLKYQNLSTSGAVLAQTNFNSTYSDIQTIIKNNKGNFEKIQNEIDLLYTTKVLPNLANINANDKILNKLKPLEMTPAMIEDRAYANNVLYESLRAKSIIEMMVSGVNFDSGNTIQLAADLDTLDIQIDNYIQKYLEDPSARKYDMDDATVSEIVSDLQTTKNNLLSVQSDKIQKAENAQLFQQKQFSTNFINEYKSNSYLSVISTPSSILENLQNTPNGISLFENQSLFMSTLDDAVVASQTHKIIQSKKEANQGVLPNIGDLTTEINTGLGLDMSEDEISRYVYSSMGGMGNYTADQMISDITLIKDEPLPESPGGVNENYKTALKNYQAASVLMQQGYYPPGLDNYFAQVDRIMAKNVLSEDDIARVNQSLFAFNYINNNSNDLFFPTVTGAETPSFFAFLNVSRGQNYEGVNITDIQDLQQLQNEYQKFVESPYNLETISNILSDNNFNITEQNVENNIVADIKSQFGVTALKKYILNKVPFLSFGELEDGEQFVKTSQFTELFSNIPQWKKIVIGMSLRSGYGEEADAFLSIDPFILEQFNQEYIQALRNNGVDFTIAETNTPVFLQQVEKVRDKAINTAAYNLNRGGFGISKYQSMNEGGAIVQNPIEDQIPYQKQEEKDLYIAAHIKTHIESMENKYGKEKMKDVYPGLYFDNFLTDKQIEKEFNMERVIDLMDRNVFYFINEGEGYSYHLNPNGGDNFFSNSYELSMDVDDPQFFTVDDVLTTNDGKIFSKQGLVSDAVKEYLNDSKVLNFFRDRGIDVTKAENFLYTILYPGTYAITNKEDLMEYLDKNKIDIDKFPK
jgi:hypothetical protein